MIDFFCNIYTYISDRDAFLTKARIFPVCRALTRLCANLILPIYVKWSARRVVPLRNDGHKTPIIVSLTSFPARINRIWLVIESLLRQTYKPNRIILWLSKEQFADSKSLPMNLLRLQSKGVEIKFVDGDLRSHKKYIYTMALYPDAIVVTVDDDIFYPSHALQYLLDAHRKYPKDVIANITHQLQYDSSGQLRNYTDWKHNLQSPLYDNHTFQVGVGGVLYPPHCAHKDICNTKIAYQYCPCGDDIWLFAMCRLAGTTIRSSTHTFVPLPIYNLHSFSLSTNNLQGGNDIQIKQLTDYCLKQYGQNPFEQ
jgi:hypothetical protein